MLATPDMGSPVRGYSVVKGSMRMHPRGMCCRFPGKEGTKISRHLFFLATEPVCQDTRSLYDENPFGYIRAAWVVRALLPLEEYDAATTGTGKARCSSMGASTDNIHHQRPS